MRKSWLESIKTNLLGEAMVQQNHKIITFGQIVLLVIAFVLLLLINACSPDNANSNPAPRADTAASTNTADIEDHIVNSYARLAAKRSDICPKLLEQDIGRKSIKRSAEVMVDSHCDYFLYLHEGELITVTLDNPKIEALLIVPTIHDFANGGYVVDSYDKHVIRLSYNGADYKPKRLQYDVTIKVKDQDEVVK